MSERTTLPSKGYARSSAAAPSSLVFSVADGEGNSVGPFDFAKLPGTNRLLYEVAQAFLACTGADGPWQATASIRSGYFAIAQFIKTVDALGDPPESLSALSPEHWWAWRTEQERRARWPGAINQTRVLLRHAPQLPEVTQRAMRARHSKPRRRSYDAYSPSEFQRIREHAFQQVHAAESRIRRNVDYLHKYEAGRLRGVDEPAMTHQGQTCTRGQLLEELSLKGVLRFGHHHQSPARRASDLLGTGELPARAALFPTKAEILSAMVLLVCDRGYNLSTLNSMTVPDTSGMREPGSHVLTMHLDKPRRGSKRHFTHTFTGRDARTLQLVVSMTRSARQCLARLSYPTRTLFVATAPRTAHPSRVFMTEHFTNGDPMRLWSKRLSLPGPDGEPLRVSFARLRLSEQVLNRKSSQNSDQVSEDVYRRPDPQTAQMVSGVVADGQRDAIAHAHETVRMRFTHEPLALGLPAQTQEALTNGRLDTAVAGCLDHMHSPFGEAAQPCPASFLLCLACPNAVATPQHMPRLSVLERALSNLASIDPDGFARAYQEHHSRLTHLLESFTTPAERQRAYASATDADRETIERLLRRELEA